MKQSKTPCALLLNDIHASKDNIAEFHANWDEAVEICQARNIPEIIVGGDLWQSRSSQTLSTLLAVSQAIMKAVSLDIYVTLAEGNHDKVDQESLFGYSHIFIPYPNVEVVTDYTVLEYGDDVALYIMSYFPEDGSFEERLNDILANDFDTRKHNILYIHEGINGALATSNDKELSPKIFRDFDKVLVGHYHDRCKIKGTNIEYIGSSRQHNFGEDEAKGYTILYTDGSYEFVENQVNVRYKTMELDISQVDSELLDELAELKATGKYKVKARINCDSTEVSNIDKQKLIEAGATKIEIVTERIEATEIESHSFDQKFDKNGIKKEYASFCSNKEISSEMGLKYLDKIN